MRQQFLEGAAVIEQALQHPGVARAWDEPSVLEEQTVGSLAGHLARGGVWVVADYLDADPGTGEIDFSSAADYFARIADTSTPDDHAAVRARGAAAAEAGPDGVHSQLVAALRDLPERLRREPDDRRVSVFSGRVMSLDEYLVTRIVEQVVHLDDLARSLDVEPWPNPPGAVDLVLACGGEVARRRLGDAAAIRSMFREGFQEPLPVL